MSSAASRIDSEIAILAPRHFDLDGRVPVIRVRPEDAKNKKAAELPLPADAAAWFRRYLADRPTQETLWPGKWNELAADMLRLDLEAAGIPYRDADGLVCDFHALRHSWISLLSRSGVHPKVAQELARHSDIRITMQAYTHTHLHDLAGAVESLPPLLTPGPAAESASLASTGTDGNFFNHPLQHGGDAAYRSSSFRNNPARFFVERAARITLRRWITSFWLAGASALRYGRSSCSVNGCG